MHNGIVMQYFEWAMPNDGKLWLKLKNDAVHLRERGITAVWIPPPCKATKQEDPGYGLYDGYDLGEFDQKGTVRTKYGTKHELKEMIAELHRHEISVYMDTVLNHRAAADHTETFRAREVHPEDRGQQESDVYEIEGWTGFDFPGRNNTYSDFKWHWYHFSGTDFNQANGKTAVYQILGEGKAWSEGVDDEYGNYDYLMFADVDFDHPEVIEEMKRWGVWIARELDLDGMRLDAIKHVNNQFIKHFLDAVRADRGEDFYAMGEYWKYDAQTLKDYLAAVEYKADLFDVPLHFNFKTAADQGGEYDLQQLLTGTLVADHPGVAVTFVDNHDSQQGSALESEVAAWFKPSAYGLILLMKEGYPCVFYGDYYGMGGNESPHRIVLDILLRARRQYAHGEQHNFFDHPALVGFVRNGDEQHPGSGLALLISNSADGEKTMHVGEQRKGEVWHDITGSIAEDVTIDEGGNGAFRVLGMHLAVWVQKEAASGGV